MSFHPERDDAVKTAGTSAGIINATKKTCEKLLLSVSFWNKISVIACIIAVSADPFFLYVVFLDENTPCLGTNKNLSTVVLITRSLTDLTFLFHITYQLREAVKAVLTSKSKPVQRSNSKLFFWFENAKAIAKKLSWSSFLTDILAILPIPQVLILVLFYSPKYGYSVKERLFEIVLLAQYVPRTCRIFISSKLIRKNSSMWGNAAFYFFMYILSSHVIGAFRYFTTVQMGLRCWSDVVDDLWANETLQCGGFLPPESRTQISNECVLGNMEDPTPRFIGTTMLHEKLFYFLWWGLKNLSNFGTDIDPKSSIWDNSFAILISGIGLVLFALLIGNMQQCMRWEENKVTIDKVQKKEQELQEWMDKNGLPEKLGRDDEKLRIEIMHKITETLKDANNAEVQNLFSLLPWNTVKDFKLAICMSMLKKVRRLENMDERGLKLICQYLKPVTYTEKTFAFRMGEPLDSIIFIMEGIMLVYPTSTTATTSSTTYQEVGGSDKGSPTTIRCSLENGDVYGDKQLLSWASPPDMSDISYANLPILTENVRCLSEVEGFVLTAKDLKNVVSVYKLQGNYNSSIHLVVEVDRSKTSFSREPSTVRRNRIHPSPRSGTEGAGG